MATNKGIKLLLGSKNDDVQTPPEFYALLDSEYKFDFDPCPFKSDLTKIDGLKMDWGSRNFINPPYSNIKAWLKKGIEQFEKGKFCFFLIPVRTGNKYWHELIFPNATKIVYLERGIIFSGYTKPLPLPMCFIIFDPTQKQIKTENFIKCSHANRNCFEMVLSKNKE